MSKPRLNLFIFLLLDEFMVKSTLGISSNLLNFPDVVFE